MVVVLALPRWCSGQEPTCQYKRHTFDPWVRKIPWSRKWQPTPLPGKSHEQRSLAGYSPLYCKSWTWLSNGACMHAFQCSSVAQSYPTLRPHEPQHTRPPCPSTTPRVYPNSCPLSWWCHPTISSSVVPFSSCPQSFPASGSLPKSQLFASGDPSTGASDSASVLPGVFRRECKRLQSCWRPVLLSVSGSELTQ